MCYPICYEPTEGDMDCKTCINGITAAVDQLLEVETLDVIVGYLQDGLCPTSEDPLCLEHVDNDIRNGLPLLRDSGNLAETDPMICNMVVEGTCPAGKRSIFKKRIIF